MNLNGLSFLWFILKWSAGKEFWYQLRVTDKSIFKKFVTVERTRKKVEKCKLGIKLLVKCRESNLCSTFIKVKRLKDLNKNIPNRYHRGLPLDEISNEHKRLKSLNKQLTNETNTFKSNVTWIKSICISYSINIVITKYIEKVQQTHRKKPDNLFRKKQQENGLDTNPNNIIWSLTWRTISNEEYEVLRYGLHHGIATHQNTSDVIATAESVWDQISK